MRRRTKRAYRALLWLLLAALLAAAGVAAVRLWRLARDEAQARRLLWEMRQTALSAAEGPGQADAPPGSAPAGGDDSLPGTGGASASHAASGGETGFLPDSSRASSSGGGEGSLPGAASAAGSQAGAAPAEEPCMHACPIDFEALRARYPDVIAWLTGCDGEIDTPIVQGADNAYYLEHLPDGTRNRLGAAFLDSENRPDFTDDQSFLFGHHMDTGGGVFSPLLQYQDTEYALQAPAFVLHTPNGCFSAEVFAAFVIQERAYPYQREFSSAEAMRTFLNEVRARSQAKTPVQPAPGDRILTLCTCTSKTNDLRCVVCTRLVPLADGNA